MDLTKRSCRVCLQTEDDVPLHDWYLPMRDFNENVTYLECFLRCTRLNLAIHPEHIAQEELSNLHFFCTKCCNDLRNAYKFLMKSQKSDRELRAFVAEMIGQVRCGAMKQENCHLQFEAKLKSFGCLDEIPLVDSLYNYVNPNRRVIANATDELQPERDEEKLVCVLPRVTKTMEMTNATRHCTSNGRSKPSVRKQNASIKKVVVKTANNTTANKVSKSPVTRSKFTVTSTTKRKDKNVKQVARRRNGDVGDGDKNQSCEYCAKSLPASKLKRHITQCHGPKPELLCYTCPRIFNDSGSLHRHEATHRERQRKYKCKVCEQTFFNKLDCQRHTRIHDINRKPQFQCDLCDKSFLHKGSLKSHHLFHTGPLFECKLCPKRYVRAQDLQIHLRSHSGELPYKCTKCNKSFMLLHSLNVHLLKHDGVRYKCDVCGKEYVNGSTLSDHRKEHTGMPRKCSLCEKGFPSKSKTLRHIKHAHKISDPAEMEKLLVEVKLERVCRKPRLITLTIPENQKKSREN